MPPPLPGSALPDREAAEPAKRRQAFLRQQPGGAPHLNPAPSTGGFQRPGRHARSAATASGHKSKCFPPPPHAPVGAAFRRRCAHRAFGRSSPCGHRPRRYCSPRICGKIVWSRTELQRPQGHEPRGGRRQGYQATPPSGRQRQPNGRRATGAGSTVRTGDFRPRTRPFPLKRDARPGQGVRVNVGQVRAGLLRDCQGGILQFPVALSTGYFS